IEILSDYIAPTALHSSDSRNARTACLEGTRVAAIEELSRWVEDSSKKNCVCWVFGGAGVGKSAISQTICEDLRRKSQLAASFFFSRNDRTRSSSDPFFPTLAHQLATLPAFRNARLSSSIEAAILESPKGLNGMNLEGQFQSLIFQPCTQIDTNNWKTLPRLVVIDGLDECIGGSGAASASEAQEILLSIIHKAISADPPLPLQFMIFSRPESTIRDFFRTVLISHKNVDMRSFRAQADGDIGKYLTKQFKDIIKSRPEMLAEGPVWPGKEAVGKLIQKADGHFIYVVTAMKYITSNSPASSELRTRLDIVLQTEETALHPDLSDLDQLYHTILQPFGRSNLYKLLLLPILQFLVTPHPTALETSTPRCRSQVLIAALLKVDIDQCSMLLAQLRSVLHVPGDGQEGDVSILHASFSDFLCEGRRSHEFHVEPLNGISYLDRFSCYLLYILEHKIRQYKGGERIDIADRGLEMWSLNPWSTIKLLFRQYTPSGELVSAVTNFDLYGYLNMVLDKKYSKELFGRFKWSGDLWRLLISSIYLIHDDGFVGVSDSYVDDSRYQGKRWGPFTVPTHHKFFNHLCVGLIKNVLHLQDISNSLKMTPREDGGMCSGHDCLHQFFEGDWLVALPKSRRNRRTSSSRLGCIALFAVRSLPWGVPHDAFALATLLSTNTIDSWSIASPLKILPRGEKGRTPTEVSGNELRVYFVSSRQRIRFGEEVARTIQNNGGISAVKFDNLVVRILTDTPMETSGPNDVTEEIRSGGVAGFPHQLATSPPLRKAGLSSHIDETFYQIPNGLEGLNFKEQFQSLVFQPCVQINAKNWKKLLKLVIIDGLDECMGGADTTEPSQAQEALLSIIHKAASADSPLPLHFMIFSRPEPRIRDFFQNTPASHKPVDMRDFRSQADSDIRQYLQKKFTDLPESQPELLIAGVWPGEQAIEKLVVKADGHFIYVVTAMKYITADNPSPADLQERLCTVLHTEDTASYPDLSDLDQLYHTILRRFGRGDLHKQILLPVLQLMITSRPEGLATEWPPNQDMIAGVLKIDSDRCSTFLSQLRSVLHVPNESDPQGRGVQILHASFSDFLTDGRRSHEFHVHPMNPLRVLDGFSCYLMSILKRKIEGERMDLGGLTSELWSFSPWKMVQQLGNHTLSEELISAAVDIDLYGYVNLVRERYALCPPGINNQLIYSYSLSLRNILSRYIGWEIHGIDTCLFELQYSSSGLRLQRDE
ncbi:hypothetical protein AAF712_016185, partial [Marasmius tenuissimus]